MPSKYIDDPMATKITLQFTGGLPDLCPYQH